MKNRFTFHKKGSLVQMKALSLSLMILMFILPVFNMAQPSSMPDGSLFFEEYRVEEQVRYLIPDTTEIDVLTEWDWIEMKPYHEIRTHRSIIDDGFRKTSRIDIQTTDKGNKWDYKLSYHVVDDESSRLYSESGEIISDIPHSNQYLEMRDTMTQLLIEYGFQPTTPFSTYENLPIEDIQTEGYQVVQSDEGYKISNDYEEIYVYPEQNMRIHQISNPEYDTPYYTYESFTINDQGYLAPAYKEIRTKVQSENGHCLIKLERSGYSDYILYYSPTLIHDEEEKNPLASDFLVYPNPTDFSFNIEYKGEIYTSAAYEISISNQMSEPVYSQNDLNTAVSEEIILSGLPQGLYFILFTIDDQTFTKKIFKN